MTEHQDKEMTFDKVLIANRGEIARRVIRTCRLMGLATVAVYSDADADEPHAREADEAIRLGPAPAAESYLVIDQVIEAARLTGAGAIHPGYGFLAENAAMARACDEAGIVFIGPDAATIEVMGSKIEAKALMASVGVPVVKGFDGGDQSDAAFVEAASSVGFPLLVKASAGGGGKGMRVVEHADDLSAALAAARREALGAFGDDRLLLEHYVAEPRHIEVQILGDSQGNIIHLYERECSVQRRHQKIIEETPAPGLSQEVRAALTQAAVSCGRALAYRSAGTVEFVLAPDGSFYFLEVNTRLQVEHPVTEVVCALDLVRLQIEVAMGQALSITQQEVAPRGHAIECRLYAEDPARGYLPQTGTLVDWRAPTAPGVRVDSGVEIGSVISVHYDPMIAKLIAGGADRAEAIRRMRRALDLVAVAGLTTNRQQLAAIMDHEAFRQGTLTTHFLTDHAATLAAGPLQAAHLSAAAVAATIVQAARRQAKSSVLPALLPGFRNNRGADPVARWTAEPDGQVIAVSYRAVSGGYVCAVDGSASFRARAVGQDADGTWVIEQDGHRRRWRLATGPTGDVWAHSPGLPTLRLAPVPRFPDRAERDGRAGCRAPMTAKVIQVAVAIGDVVEAGQPVVVLEAMKMEHTIEAPWAGEVAAIGVSPGDVVEADTELVVVTAT